MAKSKIASKKHLPGEALLPFLKSFEIDAVNICRGFQVAMAVNVFGVGIVLPNDLSIRRDQRAGF